MKSFLEQFINEFKDMHFVKQGLYFGYPPCCIVEFVEFTGDYMAGKRPSRGLRKLHGTGYVPCKDCNKKTEKQLLKQIADNRKCELPFPKQPEF